VIDGDATNRKILNEQLNEFGCDFTVLESAKKGLSILEKARLNSVDIDCVIVDYILPDMDGSQFVEHVRGMAKHEKTPIIVLTSVGRDSLSGLFQDLNISSILNKPYRLEQLKSELQSCFG